MGCLRSLVPSRLSRQREVEEGSERHPAVPDPEVSTADFRDNVLREAEVIARKSGTADCLRKLQQLWLEQFGELMISLPRTDYARYPGCCQGWHPPKRRRRGPGRTEQIFWPKPTPSSGWFPKPRTISIRSSFFFYDRNAEGRWPTRARRLRALASIEPEEASTSGGCRLR